MSARAGLWILLGAMIAIFGCKKLNAPYCDSNDQCPTTHMCLANVCLSPDAGMEHPIGGSAGGAAGAAGSMGGAGGAGGTKTSFTCPNPKCNGATPICDVDAGACRSCDQVAGSCDSPDGGTPVCVPRDAGLKPGMCVGCLSDSECKGTTPICELGGDAGASRDTCRACETGTNDCTQLNPVTPVCVTASTAGGAQAGTCVGCLANSDCTSAGGAATTKPICELTTTNASAAVNTCRACVKDAECGGPGICMTDGHCASDAETIYVKNDMASSLPTCTDNPPDGGANGGTKAHPFCSLQPIPSYVSTNRDLVLVDGSGDVITGGTWSYANQVPAQLSIVGQLAATIGSVSTPVFSMQSGSVYIRGVTFSLSSSIGIKTTGGTLTLNGVTVDSCKGGGLVLSGTTFHIENTTVTNNGPGPSGTVGGVNISTAGSGSYLNFATIENNKPIGITCDAGIATMGAYVMSNTGGQIAGLCNFMSCVSVATNTCGAPQ